MSTVCTTTFAVSDVEPARLPLYEVPYPHAVAALVGARTACEHLDQLDWEIHSAQTVLPRIRRELDEPLPGWVEDNRRAGLPEEADLLIGQRQKRIREMEQRIADLKQRRSERTAALDAHYRSAAHGFEACSRYHGRLVAAVFHPLLAALHSAFSDHRPVCLSPDMIWLLITQGVANHINVNAEALRKRFVQHEGKLKLIVRRDDFVKGSPENPWPEVFPEFSRQIRQHTGDTTHDFFLTRFSTTGAAEQAAFEIVLLDAMQSYFTYELHTVCGIPAVTLEGTPDDWRSVLERTRLLPRFDLASWQPTLETILNQFVDAAEGRPDAAFWKSIYKYQTFSGGNAVTGWITAFFPYLKHRRTGQTRPNPWLDRGDKELRKLLHPDPEPYRHTSGPAIDEFPLGLARAPLLWRYLSQEFDMELLGGFVGVAQDAQTLCLRPEIGWAVREAGPGAGGANRP